MTNIEFVAAVNWELARAGQTARLVEHTPDYDHYYFVNVGNWQSTPTPRAGIGDVYDWLLYYERLSGATLDVDRPQPPPKRYKKIEMTA